MAYSVIDKVYTIFIDVMTGSSNGYGKPTFYNTDSHTSFIELTVTNGSKEFNMTEFSYMFTVEKPDGTKYTNEYTTQDKSKLVIPVDAQMISCTGNCNAQLYVNKEVDGVNKTLTMVEFNYTVYKGLHEGLISESIDFDNVYVKILNKLDYIINNGADLTGDQAAQLSYAYQHSKSPHAPANIVETMHTEIGEAIDAHHKKVALSASQVGSYEGTDITIKPSNEGLTKDIVIKGRTLQNIIKGGSKHVSFNKESNPNNRGESYYINSPLVNGKTYSLIVDVKTINNCPQGINMYEHYYGVGDSVHYTTSRITTTGVSVRSFVSTGADRIVVYVEGSDFDNGGVVEFENVMILEGDYTQEGSYIPHYFEGIKSVGEPKNLFNKDTAVPGWVGNDGTVVGTGDGAWTSDFIPIEPSTTYAKSGIEVVGYYDSDKVFVLRKTEGITFTTPKNAKYMRVTVNSASLLPTYQVEKGTIETAYEPYLEEGTSYVGYGSCGKNLMKTNTFEVQATEGSSNYVVLDKIIERNIEVDPKKTYVVSYTTNKGKVVCCKLLGCNTPIPSNVITHNNAYSFCVNKGGLESENRITGYKYLTITTGGSIHSSIVQVGETFTISELQLEEATFATAYEPYQEDIKEVTVNISGGLKSLSKGVQDYLYSNKAYSNNLWLAQVVGVYTLTGDENMYIEETLVEGCIKFIIETTGTDIIAGGDVMCNRLVMGNDTVANSVRLGTSNKIIVNIQSSLLPSADMSGFRQWLKDNPTTVYYKLANPKYSEVAASKSILKTYNVATHVFSKHDFKPSIAFSTDFVPLTSDAKQYCIADDNKSFILPDIASLQDSNALEIHLFVKMLANVTLSFPSNVLWNDLAKMNEVTKGSTAEFIFTYIKTAEGGSWLGTVVPHK